MERVAGDVEVDHLGVADLDALLIDAGVECALYLQTGFRRRRADQLHHRDTIRQRPAAPVLRDVAEQAMLYSVPLGRARRIVVDVEGERRGAAPA
jgi:hypothetical protein